MESIESSLNLKPVVEKVEDEEEALEEDVMDELDSALDEIRGESNEVIVTE